MLIKVLITYTLKTIPIVGFRLLSYSESIMSHNVTIGMVVT